MEDHYIVFSCSIEIIDIRSYEDFLSKVYRETRHISSQSVYEIYLTARTKRYLEFSVGIIVDILSRSAYRLLERNSPEVLAILAQTEGQMGVLIEPVHLAGTRILHLEWSRRHSHDSITFESRSLRLLKREFPEICIDRQAFL